MALNIRKAIGETYNKAVIAARDLQEAEHRKKGYQVTILVEREDGKRLLVHTYGVKGHVQLDDYDEENIKRFLGHPLGGMRAYLKAGKKYVDSKERITFTFTAPKKMQPIPQMRLELPNARKSKRQTVRSITAAPMKRKGFYSMTLGRWIDE